MKSITVLLFLILTATAHAGVVTLSVERTASTNGVVELTVGRNESAELLSSQAIAYLDVIKDDSTIPCDLNRPVFVAGPATIRLTAYYTVNLPKHSGFFTFRISPEAYPPDRALIVCPGTNQTQVALECSTNLVQWFPATNGIYGPLPEAKFFRIKAENLP